MLFVLFTASHIQCNISEVSLHQAVTLATLSVHLLVNLGVTEGNATHSIGRLKAKEMQESYIETDNEEILKT